DEPGEWYLDRTSGILYLYPPTDLAKATVEISLLSQPMIEAQGVSHVRFEGLILDLARGDGIILKDAEDCLVGGCTIRRMAGNGISILGGHRDVLVGCDIHTIGRRASEVIGGDRATLTPGGHVVENCRIHDFGRIDRTYTPGVQLEGVGNRVAHNLFYSCPSSVARIEGNDHLIEFNEVRHAVLESDDQGAMELFGNPTYRGVVFRYNLFREIGPQGREVPAVAGRAAIRFDDVISGMLVYGNIFYRAAYGAFGAVQINSGRDDLIENNLFAECRECVTGGWEESNGVWQQIKDGRQPADFYLTGLYRTRYPSLAHLFDLPALNYLWRNVAWRCAGAWEASPASTDQGKSPVVPPARARPDRWELFQNVAATDARIGFVNAAKGDFRFRQGTAAFFEAIGFHPIPVEEIGLYRDRYRRELPRGP
ncbi:MAG: right-handed parallel beta-helix repeat-containing protein, partial [Opitutaceae bacterium]